MTGIMGLFRNERCVPIHEALCSSKLHPLRTELSIRDQDDEAWDAS